MNRIYSLVWNRALRTLQVASELATSTGGGNVAATADARHMRRCPLALACAVVLAMGGFTPASWAEDPTTNPVTVTHATGGAGLHVSGYNGGGNGGSAGQPGQAGTGTGAGAGGAGGVAPSGKGGNGQNGLDYLYGGGGGGGGANGPVLTGDPAASLHGGNGGIGGIGVGNTSGIFGAVGGGGAGGDAALIQQTSTIIIGTGITLKGGTGGNGTGSPVRPADASGAGGGGAGLFISGAGTQATLHVQGAILGGAGGNGIRLANTSGLGSSGGGGAGVVVTNGASLVLDISSHVAGGAGGTYGSTSGNGGDGIVAAPGSHAKITVGAGAQITGGAAPTWNDNADPNFKGGFGNGIGGAGLRLMGGGTVINAGGTIAGGDGGALLVRGAMGGSSSPGGAGSGGAAGGLASQTEPSRGSSGIITTGNVQIITSGAIDGGVLLPGTLSSYLYYNLPYAPQKWTPGVPFPIGDAVDFSGGGNTLTLESGYSFRGNVVSTSGATNGGDTLALGGSEAPPQAFDLSDIVAALPSRIVQNKLYYIGFNRFAKTGSSTWTLTRTTTDNHAWDVQAGTLIVGDAASIAGAVTVQSGATLGGYGSVGATTVTSGGILAPGSSTAFGTGGTFGTFTVNGNLDLHYGSIVDLNLGGSSASAAPGGDYIKVNGGLTLGGATLNLANINNAMGPGLYNIITHTSGPTVLGGMSVATAPPAGQTFTVQYIPGQVNLLDTSGKVAFWAAAPTSPDVFGGKGTWTAQAKVWTNASATAPRAAMPQQPGFAEFQGTPGTITVDSSAAPIKVTGMQFFVPGYSVVGKTANDAITLVGSGPGNAPVINVGNGQSASSSTSVTVGAALAGTDGFTKTDYGTLILAGQNQLSGAITVAGGTLAMAPGATLGSDAVTVDDATGHNATFKVDTGANVSNSVVLNRGGALVNNGALTGTGTVVTGVAGAAMVDNNGMIGGDVSLNSNAANAVTLQAGSLIAGDLDVGTNAASTLTLDGDAGTTASYAQAVGGTTTFAGAVKKAGNGTWTLDDDGLASASSIEIVAGALNVGNGTVNANGFLGASAVTVDSPTVVGANAATLDFLPAPGPGGLTVGNSMSGNVSGTVRLANAGTLTYTGHSRGLQWTLQAGGTLNLSGGAGIAESEDSAVFAFQHGASGSVVNFTAPGGTVNVSRGAAINGLLLYGGVSGTGGDTLVNAGAIMGGSVPFGGGFAHAVDFSGGGNTLVLEVGSTVIGNIASTSGTTNGDTLILGDDTLGSNPQAGGSDTLAINTVSGFANYKKTGSSAWTLTGKNTDASPWDVQDGTLIVGDGSTATSLVGDVTVDDDAVLGGYGTVGTTTVASGATLAPGSSTDLGTPGTFGTFTVNGNLTLDSGSSVQLNLGAPGAPFGAGDNIDVTGDLALEGATLNVANVGAMGPGLYNVISYDGALSETGDALTIGSGTPALQKLSLQYIAPAQGASGQVNLVDAIDPIAFWSTTAGTPGGTGNWAANSATWTNQSGTATLGAMNPTPGFAEFQGAQQANTVTVDDNAGTINVTGMQFFVDGYTVVGKTSTDAITLVKDSDGNAPVINVGNGTLASASDTATISAVLAGSDGFTKTDYGTLVVSGNNTYTGTTTINGGTLEVAQGGTLGTGTVTVNGSTTGTNSALKVDDGATLANHIVLNSSATSMDDCTTSNACATLNNAGTLNDSTDAYTVEADSGYAVINNTGSITGVSGGVSVGAGAGTVDNAGTIIATDAHGAGVVLNGANSALTNSGTISATGAHAAGATLAGAGGSLTNIGGSISGGSYGAYLVANATVSNSVGGTISGGSYGAYLVAGGSVTNGAGSTISGGSAGVRISGGAGNLTNAGTITGNVQMDPTAANVTTLTAGGSIKGNLDIGTNKASTLTLNGDAGTSQLYSGAVTGTTTFAGALTKDGTGTWVINNNNLSGTSGATVSAGTLIVGDDAQPNVTLGGTVTVANGATFGGFGTVGGLDLSGTLNPGASIGTTHVAGNVTMQPNSTFKVDVSPDGQADKLVATGTVTIDKDANLKLVESSGNWKPQTDYTIITAGGGVTGSFGAVTDNLTFLDPTLTYLSNQVDLRLRRNDINFTSVATTPNQHGVGGAAGKLGFGNPLYDPLVLLDPAGARQAFDALSGEIYPTSAGERLEAARYVRIAMNQRLLEAGNDAFGADGKPIKGTAATIWSHAWGRSGHHDGDANAARDTTNGSGVLVGVDVPVGNAHVGGLLGAAQQSTHVDTVGSSMSRHTTWLGMYGGVAASKVWRVRGGVAYGRDRLDSTRHVTFPGYQGTVGASPDGHTTQAYIENALHLPVGHGALEPYLNLAWTRVDTDGLTEHGGASALHVAGNSQQATFGTLGVRGMWGFANQHGRPLLTLHAGLGWRHAFSGTTTDDTMNFAGQPQTFTVEGLPIAENAGVFQVGLDMALGKNTHLGLGYRGEHGSDVTDQSAHLQLTVNF